MKRNIAAVLAVLVLLFCGCGNGTEGNRPPEGEGPETTLQPESGNPETTVQPESGSPDTTSQPDSQNPETTAQPEGGVTETAFQLESGGYLLDAVYTDAGEGPAVLLIAGSGPSDADETVGGLKPFADIAGGLAEQGISVLRVEKRTYRYAASMEPTDGIEEEYFEDCRAAIQWLREQEGTEKVYLLGHSLGGQIASVLAAQDGDIAGMILWNSTPRHLADVARDQFIQLDPDNKAAYEELAVAAKETSYESARSIYYYYGANEYYWAGYNEIDVVGSIKSAGIPVLIINSRDDAQIFEEDIQLWQELLEGDENVEIKLYDGMSHLGYRFDVNDQTAYYSPQEFPGELIEDFADFCK